MDGSVLLGPHLVFPWPGRVLVQVNQPKKLRCLKVGGPSRGGRMEGEEEFRKKSAFFWKASLIGEVSQEDPGGLGGEGRGALDRDQDREEGQEE